AQLCFLFALADAVLGFTVKQLRLRCTSAHLAQRLDHHGTQVVAAADLQLVTNAQVTGRLAALTTAMHLAALNGGFSQVAGLEKAGGPEPFVDTNLIHCVSTSLPVLACT